MDHGGIDAIWGPRVKEQELVVEDQEGTEVLASRTGAGGEADRRPHEHG